MIANLQEAPVVAGEAAASTGYSFPSFIEIWEGTARIWGEGGTAMYAIATIALVMFGVGVSVYIKLWRTGFSRLKEKTWRRWIQHPREGRGRVGVLIRSITGAERLEDVARRFEGVRATELVPFERDLKVMKVCVSAAPLVGLLGTVTGMLATFNALSNGGGGDQTMGMIAKGISEALITTETGLVIALPGLFFQYQLVRRYEAYKAFLAKLESVYTQSFYRRMKADTVRGAALTGSRS